MSFYLPSYLPTYWTYYTRIQCPTLQRSRAARLDLATDLRQFRERELYDDGGCQQTGEADVPQQPGDHHRQNLQTHQTITHWRGSSVRQGKPTSHSSRETTTGRTCRHTRQSHIGEGALSDRGSRRPTAAERPPPAEPADTPDNHTLERELCQTGEADVPQQPRDHHRQNLQTHQTITHWRGSSVRQGKPTSHSSRETTTGRTCRHTRQSHIGEGALSDRGSRRPTAAGRPLPAEPADTPDNHTLERELCQTGEADVPQQPPPAEPADTLQTITHWRGSSVRQGKPTSHSSHHRQNLQTHFRQSHIGEGALSDRGSRRPTAATTGRTCRHTRQSHIGAARQGNTSALAGCTTRLPGWGKRN